MEKMAAAGMGNMKIPEVLGVPPSTTKRWLQRLRSGGGMVPHNAGRPRGAEARLRLVVLAFCRSASLELRVRRVFSLIGSM